MWENYQWRLGVPFHDRLRQNGFIFISEICRIDIEKNKQIKTNHSHDNVTQGYFVTASRYFVTASRNARH